MRLTNQKREEIVVTVMAKIFETEELELDQKQNDLGYEAYCHQYPEEMRKKMADLPVGWLHESDTYHIQFGHIHRHFQHSESLRFIARHKNSYNVYLDKLDNPKSPVMKKFMELEKMEKSLKGRKTQMESQVKSVVYSVNTINQLKNIWPELFEHIEIKHAEREKLALAPLLRNVNSALASKDS